MRRNDPSNGYEHARRYAVRRRFFARTLADEHAELRAAVRELADAILEPTVGRVLRAVFRKDADHA